MHVSNDPLVVGVGRSSAHSGGTDLSETSPLDDARLMLRHPATFFGSFHNSRSVDWVVLAKALLGFLFFAWIVEILSGPGFAESLSDSLYSAIDQLEEFTSGPIMSRVLGHTFDLSGLDDLVNAVAAGFMQFRIVAIPVFSLVGVLFMAAGATIGLPLLGVPSSLVSLPTLLSALLYANWFIVLAVIPWVGPGLAALATTLASVYFIKRIYGMSWIRSFVALHAVTWVLGGALAFAAGSALIVTGFLIR